jgi:hypothetical protein
MAEVYAARSGKEVRTMSKRSYVCWVCRNVRRAEARYDESFLVRCPDCSEPMTELGWRVRVPRRDDLGAWDRLKEFHEAGKL